MEEFLIWQTQNIKIKLLNFKNDILVNKIFNIKFYENSINSIF